MNKLYILLFFTIISCNQYIEGDQNDSFTYIEERMKIDEEKYSIKPDDQFRKRIITLWNSDYDSLGYYKYERFLDTLLQNAYVRTAEAMITKVKINEIPENKRARLYESKGYICKYTSKPDSAIYYFRYSYLLHPILPEFNGHNEIHFYDEAVMTYIESENCIKSKLYYDSLLNVINKYPDSIFYIGGELKLEELKYYINLICQD